MNDLRKFVVGVIVIALLILWLVGLFLSVIHGNGDAIFLLSVIGAISAVMLHSAGGDA